MSWVLIQPFQRQVQRSRYSTKHAQNLKKMTLIWSFWLILDIEKLSSLY